jgi:nucleotide-binding universal stress UspA family protein
MSTVLVITNLTASSQHALEYACRLSQKEPARIILLHVFSFSAGYASEGVAMAALNEVYEYDESAMKMEMERMKEIYPGIALEARMVSGNFEETLLEEIVLSEASLVITGAEGDYNDFMSWDNHVLNLFIDLPVPVIIVPAVVEFGGIQNLAFACNYRVEAPEEAVHILRKLWDLWHCRFHLVYVNKDGKPISEAERACKQSWQDALQRYDVTFHELDAQDVASALDMFCQEQSIDLLAIKPHRHGIWTSIFQKSNTKALAHLNNVPVLALRASRFE